VELLQLADAVAEDIPAENLFIDVGELDAAGELGEVGVLLDQGLGVEDDGGVEVLLGDLVEDRAEELGLDLVGGEAEVQADAGELDAALQVGAVPEDGRAVGPLDHDHGRLRGRVDDRVAAGGALLGPEGAVLDVGAGDLEVAGLHQLLLHHVLDLLDVDKRLPRGEHPLGDGPGDADRRGGVALERQEGLADGDLDLLLDEGHHLVVAADELDVGRVRAGDGELAAAAQEDALGDVEGVVIDEGLLNQLVEVVERKAQGGAAGGLGGEVGGDLGHDAANKLAGGGVEDLPGLALGAVDVGHGLAEGVGDLGQVEGGLTLGDEEGDFGQRGHVGGDAVAPRVDGRVFERDVGGALEGEVLLEERVHG
jgi:hypothetical protein